MDPTDWLHPCPKQLLRARLDCHKGGISLRLVLRMVAQDNGLRDRASKTSEQRSESDCETPVAMDQPDIAYLQVTE